ncbi:MAG: GAF domain-containing protein [Anaerolineae bacterium]|nr:GAF domain-containing protein [Anaerolineae bacterium]
MNRLRLSSWSIGTRLLLGFVLLALLVLALSGAVSFLSASQVNLQSLSAYVREAGDRRAQLITTALDATLAYVETVSTNPENQRAFYNAILFRNTAAAETRLGAALAGSEETLLTGWLMNRTGQIISQSVPEAAELPLQNPDWSRTAIFQSARELAADTRPTALVVFDNDRNSTELALVHRLVDQNARLIGYLVFTLNPDTLIYTSLVDTARLGLYSFMILPDGATTLAPAEFRGQVSLESAGVNRALNDENAVVSEYNTGSADARRAVIGYHTHITFLGRSLLLLTELNLSSVNEALLNTVRLTGFPVVVGSITIGIVLALLLSYGIVVPLNQMTATMRAMLRGRLDEPLPAASRGDEIGRLAQTLVEVRQQVHTDQSLMQRRLRDRDRDIRLAQDISRALTDERDLNVLMNRVVNLIVESFPIIYHAQIFLVDSEGYAVLRASTGAAGKALLARGHRLQSGSVSIIGQVIEQGQVISARDTTASDVHRQNEFLPDTRAELAVPLLVGPRVIGALDVQSRQPDVFASDLVAVLQMLAGQITIAIENVRLYEESQRRLALIAGEQRQMTRQDWQSYWQSRREAALSRSSGNPTPTDFSALRATALQTGRAAVGTPTPHGTIPLVVPLQLRGETLGLVEHEIPARDFRQDRLLLAEELASRLAVSLDNARLFQESHKAAERERMVNQISARLTGQTDFQDIIQTALKEVGQALRTPQVALRLHLLATPAPATGTALPPATAPGAGSQPQPDRAATVPPAEDFLPDRP